MRSFAALSVAMLSACAPKIGDHCTVSTDCSPQGDRLCDTSQPDGYCTVFNCEPNACPSDSVCVAFNEATCPEAAQSVRFQRTFCMATCNNQGDCRGQYACLDVTGDPVRQVIDINPASHRICTVPPAVNAISSDAAGVPAVCLPPDATSFAGPGDDGGAEAGDESTATADGSSSTTDASAEAPDVSAAAPDVSAAAPDVSAAAPDVSAAAPDVSAEADDTSFEADDGSIEAADGDADADDAGPESGSD